MIEKNRKCIVCNSEKSVLVDEENLDVVGIGELKIGISVCKKCGGVFQNPCVPKKKMKKFYEQFSNYTNVGTQFKPSKDRVLGISEQVDFCLQNIEDQKNVFQLGCSDGFTLSVLKSRGLSVKGIDPSPLCKKLAKKNYNIDIFCGFFEDLIHNKKYHLFFLTHVLEHIYQPKKILKKIRENIRDDGYLFVEVPCLENEEKWPNGYFSFEHIQFFSETLLIKILSSCGFEVIATRHIFHNYPIISIVCRKVKPKKIIIKNEFNKNFKMTQAFLKREKIIWKKIEQKINNSITTKNNVFVWGGGIHTSKLFYRTNILKKINVTSIIDNDKQKQGLLLNKIKVQPLEKIEFSKGDYVIISSAASEKQIEQNIKKLNIKGIKIIKLYS